MVAVWKEWNASQIGWGSKRPYQDMLFRALINALSTRKETITDACEILEIMLQTVVCSAKTDARTVSACLKCATHTRRFDLAELV